MPALGRVSTQNRDGSEVRFGHVARQWTSHGHTIDLLLPERELPILQAAGVQGTYHVLREPFASESDLLWNVGLLYATRLLQVSASLPAAAADCDVAYSPSDFLPDVYPAILARRRGRRSRLAVCLFLTAPNPLRGYEKAFQPGLRVPSVRATLFFCMQDLTVRLLKRYADAVLVLNHRDQGILAKRGLKKCFVVKMGVDFPALSSLSADGAPAFDAVFLGRLHPQKGLLDAVRAWELVVRAHPKARLAIVGGGTEVWRQRLRREIHGRQLANNVSLLGFKDGVEKFQLLKAARCFLFPSRYESFGMAVLEAMACGLPVVGYDLPVFPELFPRGMLRAPLADVQGLASRVVALLEDSSLRQQVAAEALVVAAGYDWPHVAQEELAILEGLAG